MLLLNKENLKSCGNDYGDLYHDIGKQLKAKRF